LQSTELHAGWLPDHLLSSNKFTPCGIINGYFLICLIAKTPEIMQKLYDRVFFKI